MAPAMENQTNVAGPPVEEELPGRLHFHLELGAVFIPLLSVLLGAILVIAGRKPSAVTPLQQKWRRLFLTLFVADIVIAGCLGYMLANGDRIERSGKPTREAPAPRIGILFEPDATKTEPRVREVLPNSPAERAGLQAGDLIERVDDLPVETSEELRNSIRTGRAGVTRALIVRRGETTVGVSVVPELPPEEKAKGLFEPRPGSERAGWEGVFILFLPAGALVMICGFASRLRDRSGVVVWRGFLLASIGSFALSIGSLYLLKAILGGASMGIALIAMLVQMAALLGLTFLARAWTGRNVRATLEPVLPLSSPHAGLLGLYYLITGFPRVSILLWTADQLLLGGRAAAKIQTLDVIASSHLGVLGTCLFVFVVALLGPFAEETLFRGYLLPRLAAQWGNGRALFVSSLLFALFHPHYGLFMPVVFLYGYVFGWARLRSGGIGAPFFLHMSVNGFVSALMLLR
jgi:membrane protease YdiL (CAAX protease family)